MAPEWCPGVALLTITAARPFWSGGFMDSGGGDGPVVGLLFVKIPHHPTGRKRDGTSRLGLRPFRS